jgi:Lon-like protease
MHEPVPPESGPMSQTPGMVRRGMTVLTSVVVLTLITAVVLLLPVPYLVASPGISLNTVAEVDDEPVIRIEGRDHYEHDEGGLAMVTVQYIGGPDRRIDLFTALSGWLSPSRAVVPEEAVFPPGQSMEDVSENQSMLMDSSQRLAVAAALNELDIPFEQTPLVAHVPEDMPAAGLVEEGDELLEVDGEPVGDQDQAAQMIRDRDAGTSVELTVQRDGVTESVEVETTEDEQGEAIIGIFIDSEMEFPFEVEITVGDIGGPSAGMMFALGIIDRLSEESITGGHYIAGTGTITPEGEVGGVSGVAQKMVSAQDKGAEYFLVAEESCEQTLDSSADIPVVAVETLDEALEALDVIRNDGDVDALAGCS